MADRTIRKVAIIGAGIGAQHLAGYEELPERFLVTHICDRDLRRAEALTEGKIGIRAVADISAVLEDPKIDIVDVCLPPMLHVSTCLDALAVGKDVVCEKPLAVSLREIDRLEEAERISEGRIFPVFQYRYGRAAAQLDAIIATGLAGKPFVASLETHWSRGRDYYSVPWRGTWQGEQGGALLGHAIHAHDLVTRYLGPVVKIHAVVATSVNDIETEDCAALGMTLENGALVSSSVTLGAADDTTRIRFCFDGLTAQSGSDPYKPMEDDWLFFARDPVRQSDVDAIVSGACQPVSGFAGLFEAMADALDGNGGREVTLGDARRSIELVTAAYQSARSGLPVTLPLNQDALLYDGWLPGGNEITGA